MTRQPHHLPPRSDGCNERERPLGPGERLRGAGPLSRAGQGHPENDKLQAVIGSLGEGLLVLDHELRAELINPQGEEILRTSSDQVVGRLFDDLAATWRLRDRGPYAVSKMRHHLQRGIAYRNDDAFLVTEDGEIIHISLVMTPIVKANERQGAVIAFRDVTNLKVAESALSESEQRFRRIFHEAPTGMIRVDADGRLAESNSAFEELLGYGDGQLAGVEFMSLLHPEDQPEASGRLAELLSHEARNWTWECRYVDRDGKTVWTNTAIALLAATSRHPAFAIGVVEDLTERKRLEIELRHAQKLESVGLLAAGIAHEINTPIQFIGDNVSFLGQAFEDLRRLVEGMGDLSPDVAADVAFLVEEAPLAVSQTLDGIDRVAKIVRAMKVFGYRDASVRAPADLNEAVKSTLIVAQSELKTVADVRTDLGDLPLVPCYISDVNQVILNLLVNAAHAITDVVADSGGRGLVTVRTYVEADTAVVAVSDTGGGIPEAVRHRIFEPFFTTKDVGRGTGQGLALAHAVIVDRHGGSLAVETEDGIGTTFFVRLPLAAPDNHTPT